MRQWRFREFKWPTHYHRARKWQIQEYNLIDLDVESALFSLYHAAWIISNCSSWQVGDGHRYRVIREPATFWMGPVIEYVCDRRSIWESDVRLDWEDRREQDIIALETVLKSLDFNLYAMRRSRRVTESNLNFRKIILGAGWYLDSQGGVAMGENRRPLRRLV